jgi:hypothetical protein
MADAVRYVACHQHRAEEDRIIVPVVKIFAVGNENLGEMESHQLFGLSRCFWREF